MSRWSTSLTAAEQIKLVRSESQIDHDFTIIWVPRRTLVSNTVLEEHGVLGEANITEMPLHFVPLEHDLLSLELEDSFSDLVLRKDPTCVFAAAQALMLLQKQYGLFPRILGKGDNAQRLADLLQRMRSEEDVNASADSGTSYLTSFGLTPSSVVENLIIIDREVDFLTPLSTQLTYRGLLDEAFGVTNNQVEVDSAVLGGAAAPQQDRGNSPAPTAATKRKVALDSSDKLFPELRDENFATIGPTLNRTARRLQADQANIKQADQSISDLKSIINKLPAYQAEQTSLKIHTSVAEEIMKFTRTDTFRSSLEVQQNLLAGADPTTLYENIEELISRGVALKQVLRLLCLSSTINNGIRTRDLESFKRQILHAYGFQHILTLSNLEKMGLLIPRESHRGYLNPIASAAVGNTATDINAVRRALTLWVDDVAEADPEDIAYTFSGYAPLSVRLVQAALQKSTLQALANPSSKSSPSSGGVGWKGFEDVLARIRGATVDVVQKGADADASAARKTLRGSKEGPRTTLVFFLGGVTWAEIAALRFVGQGIGEASGRRLVIGATSVVNGDKVVGAAEEGRRFGE